MAVSRRLFLLPLLLLAALGVSTSGWAATITVNTLSGQAGGNAGDCTLRDAITAANTNLAVDGCLAGDAGADVIVFAAGLAGMTITLTEQDNYWYGPNALPPIYSEITIDGGAKGITIERDGAAPKMRFFYIAGLLHPVPVGPKTNPPSPGTLTLRRLTLAGGLARGGNAERIGGSGAGLGGAVYNQGTLTLDRVLATGNLAEGGSSFGGDPVGAGGGIGGDGGFSGGGGFRDDGNTDGGGEGGDFLGGEGGRAAANGGAGGVSSIGGNGTSGASGSGGGDGGGFQQGFDGGGDGGAAVSTSGGGGAFGGGGGGGTVGGGGGGVGGGGGSVSTAGGGNGGFGGGGGFAVTGGTGGFGGGGGGGGGDGGFGGGGGGYAIASGGSGGAFGGDGGTTSNSGGGGGAALGGVIFNHFGSVLLVNSTLTGNSAQGGSGGGSSGGGGGGGAGLGGALFNLDGTVIIDSSTLAGNRATGGAGGGTGTQPGQGRGGAIFNHFQDDGVGNDLTVTSVTAATLTLKNSILANTVDAPEDCFNNDAPGSVTLQGTNLIETNGPATGGGTKACGAPPISNDPQLGSLLDNGGPTRTLAISGASPAHDAALGCPPPGTDQRGVARPQGTACDLGAYEVATTVDWGDAPDPSYPTLLANKGARHFPSPLRLGDCVDTESTGQQSATAQGDDANIGTVLGTCAVEGDDEDGVVFTSSVFPGALAQVSVIATMAGLLDAWLDFDGDGTWVEEEQIFISTPLAPGANVLNFAVPESATLGATFARFRVSSVGGLGVEGIALDGEVEDYAVTIITPPPPVVFEDGFESME